jgi:hypothetical protein
MTAHDMLSSTHLMPSIVRDVSAMLVASTTFLAPGGVGSKILACAQSRTGISIRVLQWQTLIRREYHSADARATSWQHAPAAPTVGLRRWGR